MRDDDVEIPDLGNSLLRDVREGMAADRLAEWRLAQASRSFRDWMDAGAASDDAAPTLPCPGRV